MTQQAGELWFCHFVPEAKILSGIMEVFGWLIQCPACDGYIQYPALIWSVSPPQSCSPLLPVCNHEDPGAMTGKGQEEQKGCRGPQRACVPHLTWGR